MFRRSWSFMVEKSSFFQYGNILDPGKRITKQGYVVLGKSYIGDAFNLHKLSLEGREALP